MKTKICTKCGKELPLTIEYFNKRPKGSNDGFRNECKECKNKYNKQYLKENKDSIVKQRKIYSEKNKEIIAEKKKQYYKENKVELAEKQKIRYQENKETIAIFYQENKEIILEHKKKYYQENKEHIAKRSEVWRGKHKEELSNYNKNWRKANMVTVRMYTHKRQAMEKSLPFTLTTKQWENIKTHFNNTCCYCGKELPLEQEHFIPVTKGGEYTHNNIIPACKSCNSRKHDKTFFEWYPKQKFYSKKREKFILDYLGYNKDVQQLKII